MTNLHCHWTYRVEGYQSFLSWRTRPQVEADLAKHPSRDRVEIFQTHEPGCPDPTTDHD